MDFPYELIKELNFKKRTEPVAPELRPIRKIAQMLLVLHEGSVKQSASLLKLQLFNWGFKDTNGYLGLIRMKDLNELPIIRFDPSLNRAIKIAVADGFMKFNKSNGRFELDEKGIHLARSILSNNEIMLDEKRLLKEVRKKISEKKILELFGERYSNNGKNND